MEMLRVENLTKVYGTGKIRSGSGWSFLFCRQGPVCGHHWPLRVGEKHTFAHSGRCRPAYQW